MAGVLAAEGKALWFLPDLIVPSAVSLCLRGKALMQVQQMVQTIIELSLLCDMVNPKTDTLYRPRVFCPWLYREAATRSCSSPLLVSTGGGVGGWGVKLRRLHFL